MAGSPPGRDTDVAPAGTPRWVKLSGMLAIVLVLFVLSVVLTGGGPHGPNRHALSGHAGGETRWGLIILLGFLAVAGVALNWSWLPNHRSPRVARRWTWWPSLTMPPGLRKAALSAHVTSSVGLLGAVASFLALALAGLTSQDAALVRAAYLSMELTAWFVIVPLAFACLLLGIVQSLGSQWGLLRHWWVVAKLLLTVLVIIVLLLQMDAIGYVAAAAAEGALSGTDLREARQSLVVHAGGGLLVLLVPVALSLYKPRGMTRYGARKQHEQRSLLQP